MSTVRAHLIDWLGAWHECGVVLTARGVRCHHRSLTRIGSRLHRWQHRKRIGGAA